MRLLRIGNPGFEKPAIEIEGKRYDISAFCDDINEKFFEQNKLNELKDWFDKNECPEISLSERIGPCVARPSKIICIGLNYAIHATESGMAIPKEPIVFFKSTSAMCGPNDNIIIPKNSVKTDWEVELAVIIGKKTSYVSRENAMDYVAGYCIQNDISERAFQLEGTGQWVKGKSCDTFAPLGPYFVSKDEIPNPQKLNLWLKLNGKIMQNSNTDDMIFDVDFIVSYLSQFMTLLPGDVISTGTPAGVGMGLKPPFYLKAGDKMELGIDNLGTQNQTCVNYE